ncbi:Sec-independent protein translocase subunit TatA [Corynebacterium pseudotuberculosis]|uniref:Sec-independent protein translocase protein TatA n=1 Tax=Corynebacterium pseudotuberculosis 258 TaxID=1168865 RepID=A0AAU8PJY1_CORPS|nr:Sec-independent protein translocase subunit TatA [Corynebacterium pseudotuberculosis]AER69082.1 Sec-independent protein translocase protein [Corynebacterium pseudotuberculosis 1/06-A]AEQ06584.2 twin-arginine translocase TatA/TatE family subunit [Corynebacterium pseudotuberculosis CIP 52.97]AFB72381.1 twin-arginine translocase TatA/TatE family subunit [Corynebacterium pseudotuberculosis 316]AFH90856.1 twin-arginine translocase TatA/TatE family subunit [Corynebacterium pseudotuberculosis 31]A
MNLGPTEIIIILFIVILLFGAKKLPDAARSLGRSMRIFKSEVKEMSNDDQRAEQQQAQLMQQPYVQPQNDIVPPQAPTEYPAQQQQQNPQHG